ncbi:MAG: hypothetical protein IJT44_08905 [Clostridia bacterium]|nr:hypothetical protein [Clostridia bacterium]
MNTVRKLLCACLSAILAVASLVCLTVPAAAVTTISTIRIDGIEAPKIGEHPSATNLAVPKDVHYEWTKVMQSTINTFNNGFSAKLWYDETERTWLKRADKFQPNTNYLLTLEIIPYGEYEFADPSELTLNAGDLTDRIADVRFFRTAFADGRIAVEIRFKPIVVSNVINTLAVTGVPTPFVGLPLSLDSLDVSEGFKIFGQTLQSDASGKWAPFSGTVRTDVHYRLILQLMPKQNYYFMEKLTVTVNGKTTDAAGNPITATKTGGVYEIVYDLGTPIDLQVRPSATVDYRSRVTVIATASGLPSGCLLAMYDGATMLARGSATYLSCYVGEMEEGRKFTVCVVDQNDVIQKDGTGERIERTVAITVKNGFFAKVRAFFRGMFGLLPSVEIKP